ncbi:GTP 3',8-cyclase MoaA [Flammeovirga pacifica]|uniref:GTP 3',8-cyclase n=1 Tax=Flammeovirga pacifica TaxID=915059 RepID=A0A1S1YYG7_FLAPC|nr:GTP 3',8-cyclase MoaA [Flammeovirga pacifica]OHX66056.1 cyclic pyranopterin phosphate synthase MoaA [Flammeovirga pacifica]
MLTDKFNRQIKYVRLAVTDRCNLRCTYCMPEHMKFVQKNKLLTFEELLRLVTILAQNGVEKVRITGGEPFVRSGLMHFLEELVKIEGIKKVGITSNGVLLEEHLEKLHTLGIKDINLSLDAVSRKRFEEITRRDDFSKVINSLQKMIDLDFNVKVNMVVMDQKNTDQIIPMALLAKNAPLEIRYIEEMPFNGTGREVAKTWNYKDIEKVLSDEFSDFAKVNDLEMSTAQIYQTKYLKGKVGIIPAFSRTFCGTCDRLRITSLGQIRNCLYSKEGLELKDLLRTNKSDKEILNQIQKHLATKKKSGWDEEKENTTLDSMSLIGG